MCSANVVSIPCSRFLTAVAILTLPLAGFAQSQAPVTSAASPVKAEDVKLDGPGLTLLRYGRHASQATSDKGTGYVPYTDLGKPLKAARTIYSISKWEKPIEENAVLKGYIKIEKAGTYNFRTDSDWDRNELIIDGKIVCKFRDGANKGQSVDLRAGLLPIVSVGYADITKQTRVQWMPPGKTDWADIPNNLLFRAKAAPAR
jgi:hypothetical protein